MGMLLKSAVIERIATGADAPGGCRIGWDYAE